MADQTAETLSDRDLVLQFESLGDNCELGLVQRMTGTEPLGLLRFAGAPLRHLLPALHARFDGLAEPQNIRVQPENGEYMIKLTKYDFVYHADVKIGQADRETLHRQQARTVPFLVRKLLADLEGAEKIMVFRQNEPLLAADLLDLRTALAAYGPSVLLWVQEARPGHPAGSVEVIDSRLMTGYVGRLARRDNVPDLDLGSWLAVLRRAHALRPGCAGDLAGVVTADPAPRVIEVIFGKDGNYRAMAGGGWSAPEDGYTWSIDDKSALTLPKPARATAYRLEMEVAPFVAPPLVARQALSIQVNGTPVQSFDPLPRGKVACRIPTELIDGRETVELLLLHPHAASPRDIIGQNDDRRLAVSFSRLTLTAI